MAHPKNNDFLSKLPDNELEGLLPQLELRSVGKGEVLIEFEQVPGHVYFPVGAVVSIFAGLEDGFVIETVMAGKLGMVGLSNVGNPSFYRARVREPGLVYRMHMHNFMAAKKTLPGFAEVHQDALIASFRRLHISVLCAKHHSLELQIVRWMLTSLDNSASLKIAVTHQEMSQILGFSREVVTLTLGKLAEYRYLALERGRIEVLDRHALELMCCECYWLAKGSARPLFSQLISTAQKQFHGLPRAAIDSSEHLV